MIIPFKWYYYKEMQEYCQVSDALGIEESEVTDEMWQAFNGICGEITLDCDYNTETNEIEIVSIDKTG